MATTSACVNGHNHNHHDHDHPSPPAYVNGHNHCIILDEWPPSTCVDGHHHDYSTDRHHHDHHSTYCRHQHTSTATAITRRIAATITTTAIRHIATNMRRWPPPPPPPFDKMLQRQRQRRQQRQTSIPERTHGNCHRDTTTTTILFQLPTFFFISPFLNLFQCFHNDSVCQLLCRRYKYQARFGPTQSALPEYMR